MRNSARVLVAVGMASLLANCVPAYAEGAQLSLAKSEPQSGLTILTSNWKNRTDDANSDAHAEVDPAPPISKVNSEFQSETSVQFVRQY